MFAVWVGVAECGVLGELSDSLGAAAGFECEGCGDVADLCVAEVWFACRGCLSRSVAVVFVLTVQVVGVLVPGCEHCVV